MKTRLLRKIRKRWKVLKNDEGRWELWDLKLQLPANVFFDWNISIYKNYWRHAIANTNGDFWLEREREKKRNARWRKVHAKRLDKLIRKETP